MDFLNMALLFLVALLAGAINSVAGGGSFLTLPTMIFTGMSSVAANATSTVALWPGSVASIGAYRKELKLVRPMILTILIVTSLIGGILGALLLIKTPPDLFVKLLPYLLLTATLLFAFSGPVMKRLRARDLVNEQISTTTLVAVAIAQMVIAVYGGYFGGGIGILMLATLSLMGMENIHLMNALKVVLASSINGVAVIVFILYNAVVWPQALLMLVGAIIGGYGGASLARKIEPRWIRYFVIAIGLSMAFLFFVRS
jgi:uncharacterized membrane protein YfcA